MQNFAKAVSAQVKNKYLEISFVTGMKGQWPLSSLQFSRFIDNELVNFFPEEEELSEVELWPSGEIVEFSRIEQAFQVSALMRGEVGNAEWMKHLLVGAV